jgi:hypothetical protein
MDMRSANCAFEQRPMALKGVDVVDASYVFLGKVIDAAMGE